MQGGDTPRPHQEETRVEELELDSTGRQEWEEHDHVFMSGQETEF